VYEDLKRAEDRQEWRIWLPGTCHMAEEAVNNTAVKYLYTYVFRQIKFFAFFTGRASHTTQDNVAPFQSKLRHSTPSNHLNYLDLSRDGLRLHSMKGRSMFFSPVPT